MSTDEYCKDLQYPQNIRSLVYNFPYKELPNISPTNTDQIRQCLRFLSKITLEDLFYTNTKSIKYTLEFLTNTLENFQDIFAKDVFVDLLTVFKIVITNLSETNTLFELFPKLDVFEICKYLSDFEIFCSYCANQCASIMLTVLKCQKNNINYEAIDKVIIEILKNFRIIKATREVSQISGFIILRFPLNSQAYQTCSCWLMEDSIEILKNLQVEKISSGCTVSTSIKNIYTFFIKVRSSLKVSIKLKEYQGLVEKFLIILMDSSPKLIKLCCVRSIASDAKQLLALVLEEFLSYQGILTQEVEFITREEINKFPLNIKEWPKMFSRTYFWLCHLLYYKKRSVWNTTEVTDALSRLIYTKKYMKLVKIHLLKSICFIYPILLQKTRFNKCKLFVIGNDLFSIISDFVPLADRILSLSKRQLYWIMYQGTDAIKKITLKFWLDRIPEKKIPILKQILIDTNSEMILLDILINLLKTKSTIAIDRTVQLIQSLHNIALSKEIQTWIPLFGDNSKAVIALIQACCVEIPEDKSIALKIFASICRTFQINPKDEIFINLCHYAGNILTVLKLEDEVIESICKNQFLIRTFFDRIEGNNEMLTVAVLELLTKILKYQKRHYFLSENILIDLKHLLTSSNDTVGVTIAFVSQILRVKLSIFFKEDNIPLILYALYNLTNIPYLSDKAYECLFELLKSHLYSTYVINASILGMLIEERCHFSNRKQQSSTCLKFVLYWIKCMHQNENKTICYLPKESTLVSYIKRSMWSQESRVKRYIHFLSDIFSKSDFHDEELDGLSFIFNHLFDLDN